MSAREIGNVPSISLSAEDRLATYDWQRITAELNTHGHALIEKLMTPGECVVIASLYAHEGHFRSRVIMARHGFGQGEYCYFKYPLPEMIESLRTELYPRFAPVANEWNERMGNATRYPEAHSAYLATCHDAGQIRPTPLLLQYVAGDYNCLHQDLYGDHVFPIQVAILLSEPGQDFTGGEFVLTEQRPRMQSRAQVVALNRGDAVAFAVNDRPVHGIKRDYRVKMRHGVSRIRSGRRHTAGIIFHDAR
jgi:hypothetical protein